MKMTLVVVIAIIVALQCAQGQVPSSIQLRFLEPVPSGVGSEAAVDGPTPSDIRLPIQLDLTPDTTFLQDKITVTVSMTSGSATVTDCETPTAGDFCFLTSNMTFDIGENDLNVITIVIDVFDDLLVEGTETFTVSASITDPGTHPAPPGGVPPVPQFQPGMDTVVITILDNDVISGTATMGGDPHFSIKLPDSQMLCYSVQGERGSVFNLISSKNIHINALFVPNSGKRIATWIGTLGVVVGNSLQSSNVTKITINATSKNIWLGDGFELAAKNVLELHIKQGELLSSKPNTQKHSGIPRVKVVLEDVGLEFIVRFAQKHLEVFWQSMGIVSKDSHGLIGQFLRDGVRVDRIQKVLILHDNKTVPVKQRSVWGFMKHELREVADGKQCWSTIKPGEQGEGLIDGTYVDYRVKGILSTDFQFKPKNNH